MARLLVVLAMFGCEPLPHKSRDASTEIDAKIDGNGCSVQPCSILPQCGCTSAQTCDADVIDGMGTACRGVGAPGRETSTCTTALDCDHGYTCVERSCHKYCMADIDCAAPRGQCVIDLAFNNQIVAGIPSLCSSSCDPTATTQPTQCPSSWKCTLAFSEHGGSTVGFTDCWPAGGGTQGDDCKSGGFLSDALCARGLVCTSVDGGATDKCRKICTNPGASSSSQCGGQRCNSFIPAVLIAGVAYGFCSP